MSTIIEAPKSNFKTHPEGTFLAVMADCWLETRPNPWKGELRDKNDPSKGRDERETITEIKLAFLTEDEHEPGKPSYVRYSATASVNDNSNLRKFLKGWFPKLQDADFERFDADKLIGKGAYITVTHRESKGNVYANVINAAQPPKGSTVPAIPADFVRRKDKVQDEAAPVGAAPAPVAQAEGDDDLPF